MINYTMEKRKERNRWSDNWMKNDKVICLVRRKKGGKGKQREKKIVVGPTNFSLHYWVENLSPTNGDYSYF